MNRFSFSRFLLNVLLIAVSVFLIASSYQELYGFVHSNAIKVENEKIVSCPTSELFNGVSLFISHPVVAPADGKVERLVGNFTFVEKDTLIGRIQSQQYTYDILSPFEGVVIWGSFSKYFDSEEQCETFFDNIEFKDTPDITKKEEIVCSILDNNFAIIRLDNSKTIKAPSVKFNIQGNLTRAILLKNSKDSKFFKVNEYLKYLLFQKQFSIFKAKEKGVIINKKVLVHKGSETGLFVIKGNIIKFISAKVYKIDKDRVLAVPYMSSSDSLLVVTTPHLVKDGLVFGE